MKKINGYYNGNKKTFNLFCLLFGSHDWYWTKGEDDQGNLRVAVRCERCNEMRALSKENSDMRDREEIKRTIGIPEWLPASIFFSWNFIPFEITDDGAVRSLENA